jgi:hypothetical protein
LWRTRSPSRAGGLSRLVPDLVGLILWAVLLVAVAGRSFNWQPD